jgi:hypothetical protein
VLLRIEEDGLLPGPSLGPARGHKTMLVGRTEHGLRLGKICSCDVW